MSPRIRRRETASRRRAPVPQARARPRRPLRAADPALWWTVVALVALRVAAQATPGAWLWGLDAARHLPPWSALLTLACAALLFAPALAWRARAGLERAGRALARGPLALLAALATAALVLALPDRTRLVGDALLRHGGIERGLDAAALFPQALPLDLALHYTLPLAASRALAVPPEWVARLTGALDAGLAAWLAVLFARRAGATGAALPAVAALAALGGWMALFTGFGKAFAETAVLVLALAVTGLDVVRGRGSPLALAAVAGAGLLLHRSAVGALPAVVLALWTGARRGGGRVQLAAAGALLAGASALVAERTLRSFATVDAAHFKSGAGGAAGMWTAFVSPLHLLDVANLVLLLVPLAPLVVLGAGRQQRDAALSRREWALLVLLAAPFVALLPLLRPAQGVPRDFDVFAAGGAALALLLAARVAARLRARPAAPLLAPALLAAALVPVVHALWLQADRDRGLARAAALAAGPPRRPAPERAKLHEFLGAAHTRAGRLDLAVRHYEQAAAAGPSPNILMGWALVAGYAGQPAVEERAYRQLLAAPGAPPSLRLAAHERLAEVALARADRRQAAVHAAAALALAPASEPALRVRAALASEVGRDAPPADTLGGATRAP